MDAPFALPLLRARSQAMWVGFLLLLVASCAPAQAQSKSFHVNGRVTTADFSGNFQQSPVQVGDDITGTITFDPSSDPSFPNGFLSGSFQVGSAQFQGFYPFVSAGAPQALQAETDISGFGGSLPAGVGYFPDALSRIDIVNGSGTVNFYGLAFATNPVQFDRAVGFSVEGDVTLTELAPEPASLSLLFPGLLPLGLILRQRARRRVRA